MNRFFSVIFPLLPILLISCSDYSNEGLEEALLKSGSNRHSLEKTIAYYTDKPFERECAIWLIGNMDGHSSPSGIGVSLFRDSLARGEWNNKKANDLWNRIKTDYPDIATISDLTSLSDTFIINNVDYAIRVWQAAPWHAEVNCSRFREYVLPYRTLDEMLCNDWRQKLYAIYWPLVKDCKSALEAFTAINDKIVTSHQVNYFSVPFMLDAVAMQNYIPEFCTQRSVLIAAACRAVGLPVAVDNVGKWANYSNSSHCWVALVLADGTYTYCEEDHKSHKLHYIGSSIFPQEQTVPETYPYPHDFKKRALKVWRSTFNRQYGIGFPNAHSTDVSAEYGFGSSVSIKPWVKSEYVFLASFLPTENWQLQAAVKSSFFGCAEFENVADSVMVIPVVLQSKEIIPVGYPFFMDRGIKKEIVADRSKTQTIRLSRKYPLNGRFHKRAMRMEGMVLEGSSAADFTNADTLTTIDYIPLFRNRIEISSEKPLRHIRFRHKRHGRENIAEFTAFTPNGDTIASSKSHEIDLKRLSKVGSVEFSPRHDGNFVLPGHEYELVYWSGTGWQSLGRQLSVGYELTFTNVPKGALLLLHDLTEGKEERPFTVENDKQVWW